MLDASFISSNNPCSRFGFQTCTHPVVKSFRETKFIASEKKFIASEKKFIASDKKFTEEQSL